MRSFCIVVCCLVFFTACSSSVELEQREGFAPRVYPQAMFVVPFTTIMVPTEVTAGLFDLFVDFLKRFDAIR